MPVAKNPATPVKRVRTSAAPPTVNKSGRVRLSKALAKKPAAKPLSLETQPLPKKGNGASLKKFKLRTNRYRIPENEYAQLTALKKRVLALGVSAKKSELLRAGLMLLAALDDGQLKKAMAKVDFIKMGLGLENTN